VNKLTWKLVAELWHGVFVGTTLGVVVVGAAVEGGVVSAEEEKLHGKIFVTATIAWVTADPWATVHLSDFLIPLIMHSLVLNTTLEIPIKH
jgi:hypothetical protein